MSGSAQLDAIRAHPLHTQRDIDCAAHYLAWGRTADLATLTTRVLARRPGALSADFGWG